MYRPDLEQAQRFPSEIPSDEVSSMADYAIYAETKLASALERVTSLENALSGAFGLICSVRDAGGASSFVEAARSFIRRHHALLTDAQGKASGDACEMDFGEALRRLSAGERVFRSGWYGKHYLRLHRPSIAEPSTQPYILIVTQSGTVVPWLASQADVLAQDWRADLLDGTRSGTAGWRSIEPGPDGKLRQVDTVRLEHDAQGERRAVILSALSSIRGVLSVEDDPPRVIWIRVEKFTVRIANALAVVDGLTWEQVEEGED